MPDTLKRGKFFSLMGAAGAVAALEVAPAVGDPLLSEPPVQDAPVSSATAAATAASTQARSELLAFAFLTPPEQAFIEAAVERLIPSDENGPGARDAGVAFYIDQQLRGAWGTGAGQYRQGPWMEGTPEQGYQLNMTPQELYRVGIARTNNYCKERYGKTFDELSDAQQDEILRSLERGTIELADVSARTFFEFLFQNTLEGFWADPLYGGNRNGVGWRQIGFPGVAASYINIIERYNVPYRVTPVSIAEVEQGITADPDKINLNNRKDTEHRARVITVNARKR